jgi:sugar lactone lactonase YvrE
MKWRHLGKSAALAAMLCLLAAGCGPAGKGPAKREPAAGQPAKGPGVKLLVRLPDICPTPDGMAVHPDGSLVVACPNYGSYPEGGTKPAVPACFVKIDKENRVAKWFDCPVLAETGRACPMGIAFGPDGDLYVCDNQNWPTGNGKEGEINQGRVLRLKVEGGKIAKTTVVASGISHPNGVRVHKGHLYVTVSMLPKVKDPDGLLVSAVYRFKVDDQDVKVTNTREDKNLLIEYKTKNRNCQYGADGLVFGKDGALYMGNFGDGAIHKTTFNADGSPKETTIFAKTDHDYALDPKAPDFLAKATKARMRTTDGICMDGAGNIYVADFSNNAVAKVDPKGTVTVLAQSGDTDGADGGLDQPGEPIVWGGKLVVTCFDKVTGPDKVNTKHDKPYTMCVLDLR